MSSAGRQPDARGVVCGLTGFVTKAHLARAALEATAWQVGDVMAAMVEEAGVDIDTLNVDGGMTASELLLQLQSDFLDVPVVRPTVTETTETSASGETAEATATSETAKPRRGRAASKASEGGSG